MEGDETFPALAAFRIYQANTPPVLDDDAVVSATIFENTV